MVFLLIYFLFFIFPQYGDSFIEFLRFELLQARRSILSQNPATTLTPGIFLLFFLF